jgi:hypothetical protein
MSVYKLIFGHMEPFTKEGLIAWLEEAYNAGGFNGQ